MLSPTSLTLSGDRFKVVYDLTGDEATARAKAEDICIEQTIELPAELIPDDDIRRQIFGRIEWFQPVETNRYQVVISFAVEVSGLTLTQLLNVVFGNISLKPGIRLTWLDLPDSLLRVFKGPRFGREGWRELLGISARPLLCTAIKPMGFSAEALAGLTYQFALGGIDLIKDDHGLADQPFSPYRERVERCVEAVARANRETDYSCVYMPNVTAPADQLVENARLAKRAGAEALLISPGLTGLDSMRQLADDDAIALPMMSHPAFQGSFVTGPNQGISHGALFGQLARLAGADATIYPNYGGRFSFSKTECQDIVKATVEPMGHLKPIFPAPGGGMSLERIPEMLDLYGREVIFLMGGGLHKRGSDLVENCRYFRQMIEKM